MSRLGQAVLCPALQRCCNSPLPAPWQCQGCGLPLAGLAGGTAVPLDITNVSCGAPTVTAGSRPRTCLGHRTWRQCHPCPALPAPHGPHLSPSAPQPGDSVMVVPTLPDEEAKKLFPKGVFTKELPSGKKYLRYTPQPE